ncbi:hypothetical protein SanaruYs_05460 [Chryseotalea sanaruensis]|uniref:Uncharacterized protein n=1 Tax=Chryseotalea sanaruensis TaxID=2482724 RepID=A0A401U5Y7_9BACT|nr:hypothetical protein [Chryseotalea sanaruensis]GCC50331.1 hypothetical protein SanaruYs_05460 [Chryseotalea sanaruensis]
MAKKEIFKSALFVGYEIVFGEKYAGDRLDLLKNIPQRFVLYELAGLNLRLRPPLEKQFKTSFLDQLEQLKYFCKSDQKMMLPYYAALRKVNVQLQRKQGGAPIMFSRPANVFALQEIFDRLPEVETPKFEWGMTDWENLLKYYLCVNDVISAYDKQEEDLSHRPFEKLAAGSGFLNEMTVINDPIYTVKRFIHLIKYLEQDDLLSPSVSKHFSDIGLSPSDFARHIFSMCYFHKGDKEDHKFYYRLDRNDPEQKESVKALEYFSKRRLGKKMHELDVIEIKKSPVFKDISNYYVILDTIFIIDKLYELFINDFWFDTVKPNGVDIKQYRGRIGLFFESYAAQVLKRTFTFIKYPALKCLDELKVKIKGNLVEIADLYFRQCRKVCVGQIKSTGIYAKQQYGTAQSLFDIKEDDFYGVFGLYQLIDSIRYIRDEVEKFDEKFPKGKPVQVFPVLIVNEKIFQTPFMPVMFSLKFSEEIGKEAFGELEIKPLTIIHIADFERIVLHVSSKKVDWWDLLKQNYKNSLFPKPFNITLNRNKLNPDYEAAKDALLEFGILKK